MSVTQEYLKECLDYNHETGAFTWKKRPESHFKTLRGFNTFNSQCSGKETGCVDKKGYLTININATNYYAHRLAWLYTYGEFPKEQIDHINHDKKDNRISNLREVCNSDNHKNKGLPKKNTSGVVGVYFSSNDKKWKAQIRSNNKTIALGTFEQKFDAICARKSAEALHGFHPNHGQS